MCTSTAHCASGLHNRHSIIQSWVYLCDSEVLRLETLVTPACWIPVACDEAATCFFCSTLIELALKHQIPLPAYTENELRRLVFKDHYNSLDEYLRGFSYITAVMQQPEALERIAYE